MHRFARAIGYGPGNSVGVEDRKVKVKLCHVNIFMFFCVFAKVAQGNKEKLSEIKRFSDKCLKQPCLNQKP